MKALRSSWAVSKWLLHCVFSFLLWTLWLLLGTMLVLQLVVGLSRELKIPTRIVRSFENKLAIAGVRMSFDSASIDSKGRVLIENLRVFDQAFPEPLAACDSLIVDLDPWSLTIGAIEPTAVQARGFSLFVPPMHSPTGKSEAIVSQIEMDLSLDGRRLLIDRLTGMAGNLSITARGDIRLPKPRAGEKQTTDEIISAGVRQYLQAVRVIAPWERFLAIGKLPRLEMIFVANEQAGARARVFLNAASGRIEPGVIAALKTSQPVEFEGLQMTTELNFPGTAKSQLTFDVSLSSFDLEQVHLDKTKLQLAGDFADGPMRYKPKRVRGQVRAIRTAQAEVTGVGVDLDMSGFPEVSASAVAWFADDVWAIDGRGDPSTRSGRVDLEGRIFRPLIGYASRLAKRDLNSLLEPSVPARINVRTEYIDGKFRSAGGRLATGPVKVRTAEFDGATARFDFRDNILDVHDIVVEQGESLARGSYVMDVKSLDFRFLLEGQLRPLGIAGLFGRWWPNFWSNFAFSTSPPRANIDIQGIWRLPNLVRVFVGVDAEKASIREVPFDRVRTSLFIRPEFYDALELIADRPEGQARGWFTRTGDNTPTIGNLKFGVTSNLQLQDSARIFGPLGLSIVEPFVFERPPSLTLNGTIESRAAYPRSEHVNVRVKSTGPFSFFDFPLTDLECEARVENEVIAVTDLVAGFAGGQARGTARVFGKQPDRGLAFDAKVKDATLGDAIRILEEFGAKRRGEPPAPQSRFQQRLAPGKLDLSVKAEGLYQDPYSYVGKGTAELRGAELAQINLLGALSQALRGNSVLGFTSWSLETVNAQFNLEKNVLDFTDLMITGPSAKLDLKGQYDLRVKTMRFNAKFYPFEQGKTFLANAVDFVLTPVSAALELKLAGTLDDPKWYFAFGPTNLIRKLSGADQETPVPPDPAQPAATSTRPTPPLLLRR